MMTSISFMLMLIFILLSVAFFTLFEVKSLGSIHLRLGPDKVSFIGLLQPIVDFLKLFFKSDLTMNFYFFVFYFMSPFLSVFLSLFIWLNYWSEWWFFSFFYGILLFFFLSSLTVYFLLLSGMFSGSFYSKLGSFRASVQAISYEVSMLFIFLCYVFLLLTYTFFDTFEFLNLSYGILVSLPIFFCWVFSCLAETGRSPFDFIEGESELVSGFNTEYLTENFIFIFLCEYSFIMFFCLISSVLMGMKMYYLKLLMFCFIFIWVRGSFPRFRFDKLMMFCWKIVLLYVLSMIIFYFWISFF